MDFYLKHKLNKIIQTSLSQPDILYTCAKSTFWLNQIWIQWKRNHYYYNPIISLNGIKYTVYQAEPRARLPWGHFLQLKMARHRGTAGDTQTGAYRCVQVQYFPASNTWFTFRIRYNVMPQGGQGSELQAQLRCLQCNPVPPQHKAKSWYETRLQTIIHKLKDIYTGLGSKT